MRKNWTVTVAQHGHAYFETYRDALDACQRMADDGKTSTLTPGPDNRGAYGSETFLRGSNVRGVLSVAHERRNAQYRASQQGVGPMALPVYGKKVTL